MLEDEDDNDDDEQVILTVRLGPEKGHSGFNHHDRDDLRVSSSQASKK